jgi:RimJ/RimL family protein N-acetyltransferase
MMMDTVVPDMGLRSVVLDIEEGNAPSIRLADRLGADRRSPARVEIDRTGTPRTLVVYVLAVNVD